MRETEGPVADHPIVFYDGDCGLCDRFVRWMLRRDRRARRYRFAPLQGETARLMIHVESGVPGEWSVVLVDHAGEHHRSTAALRAIAGLGGGWRGAGLVLLVPAGLRRGLLPPLALPPLPLVRTRAGVRAGGPRREGTFPSLGP